MSSQAAIVMSSQFEVAERSEGRGISTRILGLIGWTVGLAILCPLFPVIGLMHLLSWLERQQSA